MKTLASITDAYKKNFERWDVLGKQVWSSPHYLIEIKTWEELVDLESQDYKLEIDKTLVSAYIQKKSKLRTDLHN